MLRSTLCLCSGHPRLRHGLAKREELRSGCTGIVLSDTSQVSATKKVNRAGTSDLITADPKMKGTKQHESCFVTGGAAVSCK